MEYLIVCFITFLFYNQYFMGILPSALSGTSNLHIYRAAAACSAYGSKSYPIYDEIVDLSFLKFLNKGDSGTQPRDES